MSLDLDMTWKRALASKKEVRRLSLDQRLERISRLKEIILDESERIVDAIQADTKKCRSDALMSEIFGVLDHLAYLEKFAAKILSDRKVYTSIALMGKKSYVVFEPLGIALVISPWNYPFYQAIVPCTLSFITGNATIYKPSEFTPLKGLVEDLLTRAGFSSDWVQVVYGTGKVGKDLIAKRPDKIFFTGSVATGKRIMAQTAELLIPVELELGGKDPSIVFEDAHIRRAAAGIAWGALTNCGQSCTSVERVYVQASIYDRFRDTLLDEIQRIKAAVDSDGDSDMGFMTTDMQVEIVKEHVQDAKAKGAKLLTGGDWNGETKQIPPIVLEQLKMDMKIAHEETFGPILPLFRFNSEAEAIEMANDSPYGLSASVWTADQKRAMRVAKALETGNVSINNVMLTEGNHALPFGGVKNSGIGRYKGEFGFYAFSNIKSVLVDSNSSKIEANWYPYTAVKYQRFSAMMKALFGGGIVNFLKFLVAGLGLESYSQKARRNPTKNP